MKTKHTKGPWIVTKTRNAIKPLEEAITIGPRNTIGVVRVLNVLGDSPAVRDANANLIAAAPELLEALNKLMDAMHINAPGNSQTTREAWALAEKAIAKAKGKGDV